MNRERIFNVLLAPHISEKATLVADQGNAFVFKVAKDANKLEIKKAVESLFDVKVQSVRTLNVKGKQKFFGRVAGNIINLRKHLNGWSILCMPDKVSWVFPACRIHY